MICRLFQFQEEDLVSTPHPVSKATTSRPAGDDTAATPHSTVSSPPTNKVNDFDIAARLFKFQHEDMEDSNNNSAPNLTNKDNDNTSNIRKDLTVSATFKFTSRLNTVTITTPQPRKSVIINDAEEPDNSMKRPLLITPFDPFFKPKSLLPITSLLSNNNNTSTPGGGGNKRFVARSASGNFVLDDVAEAIGDGDTSTAFTIVPNSSSYVPKTSEDGSRFETIDWNELDKRIEACPANISIIVHPNKSKRAVRPVTISPENKENNAISNLLSASTTTASVGHSLSSSHLHSYSQHNVLLRSSSNIPRRQLTKNATDSELSSTHSYHKSRESSLSDTSNINPNSNSQVTSTSTSNKNGGGGDSTFSGSNNSNNNNNNNNSQIPSYLKAVSTSGNMTTYILDTSPDITTATSSLSPQRYGGGRIGTGGVGNMSSSGNGRMNSYTLQPFRLKKSLQSGIYSNDSPSLPLRIKKTWESVSPQLTPTNNFTSLNKVKPYSSSKYIYYCIYYE